MTKLKCLHKHTPHSPPLTFVLFSSFTSLSRWFSASFSPSMTDAKFDSSRWISWVPRKRSASMSVSVRGCISERRSWLRSLSGEKKQRGEII